MKFKVLMVVVFSLSMTMEATAQDEKLLDQLQTEEQDAVGAIALYPEQQRAAILEAASHPEVLVRMQNIRRSTEEQFRVTLSPLSEEDQKKLYELSRYPDLVQEICEGGEKKTQSEMEVLLKDYPEEIRDQAIYVNQYHFAVLNETHNLFMSSEQAFEDLLQGYAPETQQAYQSLVQLPEVVDILSENMDMTVLLGDMYHKNPGGLKVELDSLGVVLAEQNAQELSDWKESLESDSLAMAQYEEASKEFAQEQGYNEAEYSSTIPDRYRTDVYVHHVWRPYSYWFGWPWWYTYECWYPYPWWYHWGYYYGPGNVVVFVGLPSNVYVNWHFHHHRHFYRYPHFTNHAIRHYHRHPRSYTSVSTTVRKWERETAPSVPQNWFNDDAKRPDRIYEYGKFQVAHEEAVRKANGDAPTQREYLQKNARKYPTLSPVLKEKPAPVEGKSKTDKIREPDYKQKQNQPPDYQPKEKVIEKKESDQKRIDRAKTHHQNTWDRDKPQREIKIRKAPSRTNVPTQRKEVPTQPKVQPSKKTPTPTQKQTQPKQQPLGK